MNVDHEEAGTVRVSDLGPLGKLDEINLHFLWSQVCIKPKGFFMQRDLLVICIEWDDLCEIIGEGGHDWPHTV